MSFQNTFGNGISMAWKNVSELCFIGSTESRRRDGCRVAKAVMAGLERIRRIPENVRPAGDLTRGAWACEVRAGDSILSNSWAHCHDSVSLSMAGTAVTAAVFDQRTTMDAN